MEYRIAVIPGDGIGPEIVTEAKKVLDRVGQVFGHTFHYTEGMMWLLSCVRRPGSWRSGRG